MNNDSFYIPVIRGVESNCMATYDTGKTRSASDILKLNGFSIFCFYFCFYSTSKHL